MNAFGNLTLAFLFGVITFDFGWIGPWETTSFQGWYPSTECRSLEKMYHVKRVRYTINSHTYVWIIYSSSITYLPIIKWKRPGAGRITDVMLSECNRWTCMDHSKVGQSLYSTKYLKTAWIGHTTCAFTTGIFSWQILYIGWKGFVVVPLATGCLPEKEYL